MENNKYYYIWIDITKGELDFFYNFLSDKKIYFANSKDGYKNYAKHKGVKILVFCYNKGSCICCNSYAEKENIYKIKDPLLFSLSEFKKEILLS